MHNTSTPVKQAVIVAALLYWETISAIGEVKNHEDAHICLDLDTKRSDGVSSPDNVLNIVDCRIFKIFVRIGALRSSDTFLNAVPDGHSEAQRISIYRLMDLCSHKNYRAVQNDEILDQFGFAKLALREEAKFFKFQCSSD